MGVEGTGIRKNVPRYQRVIQGCIHVCTYAHILGQWKVLDIHDRIA